tara:strand:- start:1345 stop:3120 length:1776 start_codon:yes stop_codon:yes gene_type:complete
VIIESLNNKIFSCVENIFSSSEITNNKIQIALTKKEFDGDVTLILFPLLSIIKKSPNEIGNLIGNKLIKYEEIESFNIVSGFLNLIISDSYINNLFANIYFDENFGTPINNKICSETTLVEFSSPNTNKPLHLGHIRNILLGNSISNILKKNGHNVKKVQVINDRGIHICKSMLAWQKFGEGKTPSESNEKGDFFVGKYYILFEKKFQEEKNKLIMDGESEEDAVNKSKLLNEAKQMLIKWENNDKEVRSLWEKMNNWVYDGFKETYLNLGISFDKNYYESDTYLLGKNIIEKGLEKNIFFKKEDSSVWVDLSEYKLDQKLLLRSDGTAVYITQDIGTAIERYKDFNLNNMIYVVGNEQDYHFSILFKILKKLGYKWNENCFHLSYGMVNLPDGRMKSREGTIVDADTLINKMQYDAKKIILSSEKIDEFSNEEINILSKKIGDAALKYFILKIDSKKNMLFNPAESIDFNGNTGPFIQYSYARIKSIIRRKKSFKAHFEPQSKISFETKELIKFILEYPNVIYESGNLKNPSLLANYTYQLAKLYNKFYQKIIILDGSNDEDYKLALSSKVADVIEDAMSLMGIELPEKM